MFNVIGFNHRFCAANIEIRLLTSLILLFILQVHYFLYDSYERVIKKLILTCTLRARVKNLKKKLINKHTH